MLINTMYFSIMVKGVIKGYRLTWGNYYRKQILRQHLMIKEHMQLKHAKQHPLHAENPDESEDGESKSM